MTFADTLGDKISIYSQTGNHFGFGVQGFLMQMHTSVINSDIAFGYGSNSNMVLEFNFEVQQLQPLRINGFQRQGHLRFEAKPLMTMAWVLHRIANARPQEVCYVLHFKVEFAEALPNLFAISEQAGIIAPVLMAKEILNPRGIPSLLWFSGSVRNTATAESDRENASQKGRKTAILTE